MNLNHLSTSASAPRNKSGSLLNMTAVQLSLDEENERKRENVKPAPKPAKSSSRSISPGQNQSGKSSTQNFQRATSPPNNNNNHHTQSRTESPANARPTTAKHNTQPLPARDRIASPARNRPSADSHSQSQTVSFSQNASQNFNQTSSYPFNPLSNTNSFTVGADAPSSTGSEKILSELQARIEALELEKQNIINNPRVEPDMDQVIDSSLEAYIQSFKVKYNRLQATHEEKARAQEARIRELENENSVLSKQMLRLTTQLGECDEERSRFQAMTAHVREESGTRLQQLVSKLDKVTQLLAAKDKQHQTHLEQCSQDTRRMRADISKLTEERDVQAKEIVALTERLKAEEDAHQTTQTSALELRHGADGKLATIATYEAEVIKLQSEIRQRDTQSAAQAAAQEVISKRIVEVCDEAALLESKCLALQAQILERGSESALAEAVVLEQRKATAAEEKAASATALLADKSAKLELAMEDQARFQTRLDEIEALGTELQAQIRTHEEAELKLAEEKSRLEQAAVVQAEEVARLREKVESLTEQYELATLERDELSAELQAANSKLDVSKTIHSLKLEQFQNMMRTNIEMADSIRGLMTKIDLNTPFPAASALRASIDESAAAGSAPNAEMMRPSSLMSTLSASLTANSGNVLQTLAQREEAMVKEERARQERIKALREKTKDRERAQQVRNGQPLNWASATAASVLDETPI